MTGYGLFCRLPDVGRLVLTGSQDKRLSVALTSLFELATDDDEVIDKLIEVVEAGVHQLKEEQINMPRKPGSKNKAKVTIDAAGTIQQAPVWNASPAPIMNEADLQTLVTNWYNTKQQLDKVKDEEHALRQQIVSAAFDCSKLEGTDTVDIGYGCSLKLSRELAYNATNENGEITALGNALIAAQVPVDKVNELIRWQPDIAKKVYRELQPLAEGNPVVKEAFAKAITLKPGMPQLSLITPKPDAA